MASWDVKTSNSSLEFDSNSNYFNYCTKVDNNHFINFWSQTSNYGYAQVFTINTSTWAVTTAAASLKFDTSFCRYNECAQIDSNHFINFWSGHAQIFAVNTSTWVVTTSGSILNFAGDNDYNSCYQVDTNHFINFYRDSGSGDGFVQVFSINTSTWAITAASSALEFETQENKSNSCYKIDDNHFINFFAGVDNDGFVQVFTVNTSTWAVTTAAASLEFDTQGNWGNSCAQIDSNHFINFWADTNSDGIVQVFTVNTSTWAVTTANSILEYDTQYGLYNSCTKVDNNHFINFWSSAYNDGFVQVFAVNTSTWAVTTAAASLEFDTQDCGYNSCYQVDTNHFINFWQGVDSDGYVQVFEVTLSAGPSNLKTLNTVAKSSIKTINTNTIANTKTYNTIT